MLDHSGSIADSYVVAMLIMGGVVTVVRIAVALGEADWCDLLMPWRDDPPSDPANRVPYRRPDHAE